MILVLAMLSLRVLGAPGNIPASFDSNGQTLSLPPSIRKIDDNTPAFLASFYGDDASLVQYLEIFPNSTADSGTPLDCVPFYRPAHAQVVIHWALEEHLVGEFIAFRDGECKDEMAAGTFKRNKQRWDVRLDNSEIVWNSIRVKQMAG